MKKWMLALVLFTTGLSFADEDCEPGSTCCSCCIVEGRISKNNKRFDTFVQALDIIKKRNLQILVQTGTACSGTAWCENDGCSTIIFSDYLEEYPGRLYSVDNSSSAIEAAKKALIHEESEADILFVENDSVEFFRNFNQQIDFLYLDSFDFEFTNPIPSQQHHLEEIQAAYPLLHDQSVIMIDDCGLPLGGRGKLVIEYLKEKGWKVIADKYQVLLIRN